MTYPSTGAMVQQGYYPQQPVQANPVRRKVQGISSLWHGFAKAGKSTLADTGPRPTVILDVEGTSLWTPSEKIDWNPMSQPYPPDPREGWQSAIVTAHDKDVVWALYSVLRTGQHPFNSVDIDSITEVQQRVIDDLTKGRNMDRDKWGELLRYVNRMTRMYRDLIINPVRPVWSVSMTAGTHFDQKSGKWRPLLQGASQDYLPYYVDLLGYLNARPDGIREALIGPHPRYETGERLGGRLPYSMQIGDGVNHQGYTIETMLQQVLQGR